jgi:CubicO group peptidase (beta-lactamase class C family)
MDPGPHTRAEALSVTAAWDVPDVCAVAIDGAGRVDSSGDIHHRYRLASVTKLLSTYAVLVAVEEASLALDTPAGPNGATIAHLLAHASGMGPDPDSLLAGVEQRRIYSTESFAIIAKAVADATAMSWSDYLTQAVLEPLAMADTDVSGHPGSGAVSTGHDLARFTAELLSPTLISPSTLSAATRPWFASLAGVLPGFGRHDPNPWGLGFELRGTKNPHWTSPLNSPRTFGHFGQSGTMLWVDPDRELGLVVLTNRPFGPWAAELWPPLSSSVLLGR